jgi:hypothetical protein
MVQQAWDAGQALAVHGLVYALTDGILKVRQAGGQAGRRVVKCVHLLSCAELGLLRLPAADASHLPPLSIEVQPLTPPITSLHDFEEFSHEHQLDGLRHLSLSVLEHMSFEREALRCGQAGHRLLPGCAAGLCP